MSIALFPGSFDPFHNGHLEIAERAARLFDEVVIASLRNPQKAEAIFGSIDREEMITESVSHLPNVRVMSMQTLVVDVARDVGATVIVKGLRAVSDFESEFQMAQMNRELTGIETMFLPTGAPYAYMASRLIREVALFGRDVSGMVPGPVALRLKDLK